MQSIQYRIFLLEAVKITLFCLFIVGCFKFIGADNSTLLITFNMAVMSCAAVFSTEKKRLSQLLYGSLVIVLSILLGGVCGFYTPCLAQFAIILYATLAFLLTKSRFSTNLFATGAVMFLIFTSLPFDWQLAWHYTLFALPLIVILLGFYWIFDRKIYKNSVQPLILPSQNSVITAVIAALALIGAAICSDFLKNYTALSHLYWIGLTALVVIQGSQSRMIKTSLIRIIVNACGALFIVLLMTYVIPDSFLINFSLLSVFLFLIFALGFSYIARTLFIELFVLAFTHLLGNYHNSVAFDRVILTLIGGALVILATLLTYGLKRWLRFSTD